MMVSTKKRKTPKPRIPSEIIAMESILKTGRIRFRCRWEVYDFGDGKERPPRWEQIRSKLWKFSAGSMEELLAAVHGAVLAAQETPGVKFEAMWRKFCSKCGRVMTIGEHVCPDLGEHVKMMNEVRLAKMGELKRRARVVLTHDDKKHLTKEEG